MQKAVGDKRAGDEERSGAGSSDCQSNFSNISHSTFSRFHKNYGSKLSGNFCTCKMVVVKVASRSDSLQMRLSPMIDFDEQIKGRKKKERFERIVLVFFFLLLD